MHEIPSTLSLLLSCFSGYVHVACLCCVCCVYIYVLLSVSAMCKSARRKCEGSWVCIYNGRRLEPVQTSKKKQRTEQRETDSVYGWVNRSRELEKGREARERERERETESEREGEREGEERGDVFRVLLCFFFLFTHTLKIYIHAPRVYMRTKTQKNTQIHTRHTQHTHTHTHTCI